MRGLTSTLVLVVVLAGLGAYIYFVDSKRPAASADGSSATKEKVFTVEADKINELRVTYQGESSLLQKDRRRLEDDRASADRRRSDRRRSASPPRSPTSTSCASSTRTRPISSSSASPIRRSRSHSRPTAAWSGTLKLGNKNADAGRDLRAQERREARVPGVVVPGDQLQPQAVRSARQEDPEVRSRQGRFAGAGQGRERDRAVAIGQRVEGREAGRRRAAITARSKASSRGCPRRTCRSWWRRIRRTSRSTGSTSRR